MLTIVLGAAADITEVGAIVAKARWDLRNVVDACRRRDRRWESVSILAHMEMDAVSAEDVPLLGGERAALIGELARGVTPVANPIWIPTLHGVVRFDGIDWQEVQMALQRRWPIERQLHIAKFRDNLTVEMNSDNVTNYSLKHHCINKFGHVNELWPVSWMVEYYGWLAEWTEFLRRTRIKIGMKRYRSSDSSNINRTTNEVGVVDEPMEYSIVLPTLYNW
ncbi:MAG: hypothetical protein Q7J28_09915 [Caulobacter sp.]|nr:hypothetical protein [Caulobacter sp.]